MVAQTLGSLWERISRKCAPGLAFCRDHGAHLPVEKFSAEELPKYLGFIARELKETGAFIAGPKVTIADCQLFCQLVSRLDP